MLLMTRGVTSKTCSTESSPTSRVLVEARIDIEAVAIRTAPAQAMPSRGPDHRRVVGAQRHRRDADPEPREATSHRLTQSRVGGHTTDDRHGACVAPLHRRLESVDELADGGFLESG